MKRLISSFLIVIILCQVSGSLLQLAAFELNRDFIAKNLCENRSKPKSHCNGKCHLKKELQKEEQRNESSGSSTNLKNELLQFTVTEDKLIFFETPLINNNFTFYFESKSLTIKPEIFHPPLA